MGDRLFDFSSFEVTSVISCDFKYGLFFPFEEMEGRVKARA